MKVCISATNRSSALSVESAVSTAFFRLNAQSILEGGGVCAEAPVGFELGFIEELVADRSRGRGVSPLFPVLLIFAMLADRRRMPSRWGAVETMPKPFVSVGFAQVLYLTLSTAPRNRGWNRLGPSRFACSISSPDGRDETKLTT